MKVLLDAIQAGNLSGTGSYTEALLAGLSTAECGVELHAVVPRALSGRYAGRSDASIEYVDTQRRIGGFLFRNFSLAQSIRKFRPEVVHFPANLGRVFGGEVAGGHRTVLTVHDLTFVRHPEWFRWERAAYYRWGLHRSLRYAARVITDSESTARDLADRTGYPSERTDVIPLGVSPHFRPVRGKAIESVRTRYGIPEKFFLYSGTLEPRKNIIRIVEAFDRVAEATDWDLVIAGRDGWKTHPIHEAIGTARHRDRIHCPGFIEFDDLPGVLSAAGALVWPSLWEGFGLPIVEAMACGTAVVTSNTSSVPEVAGDAAVLVNPYEVEEIAEAMQTVALDAEQRSNLEAAGLERAAGFRWETTIRRTVESYQRALAGGPRR